MEKNSHNQNNHNNQNPSNEIEDEEEQGMKYNDLLDQARKLIEEKKYKNAEFYVTLANLEPKSDLICKIKSIGIYTFVRVNYKDSQIMDYLTYKVDKYLKKYAASKFEFNNVFCMIRIFYRGGVVKLHEEDNISSLFLFRKAKNLFDEGRVENEESSYRTISSCFEDTVEKFKKEIAERKKLLMNNKKTLSELLDVLKRVNENDTQETDDGERKEYYVISANWVALAIPFIEEFINEETQIKEDEFFNISKIFNKCLSAFENTKIKSSNFVFPYKVNNHDIIQHKDFWYDFSEEHRPSNIFLSKNARENQNYFFVNKKNWEQIEYLFGCVNEIPRYSIPENPNQIDANLIKLKVLILNDHLRKNSMDYIRPRYMQMSKTDTIKDLKEKIKRCLKDLFEKKLEHKNADKFTFGTIRIFNLIYGMKKRKREILKLIYSYNDNMKRYNISGKCVENENTLIDDLEFAPGDLIIAEVDQNFIQLNDEEKSCNFCSKNISSNSIKICDICKNHFYCSNDCKSMDSEHINYHKRLNKFSIKKFRLRDLMNTKIEEILDNQNTRFGKVGLRNLGNTCFMASAIQCLSHCEDLTKFFLLKYYENDINANSPFGSGGHIANAYYQLISNLWNSNLEYLSPSELRHVLVKIVKKFQGFGQQDSHELLTYLLDSLHEDMNRNQTKPYIEMKEKMAEETDSEASKRWWTNHLKRENSIIVDLFQGQFKGTINCPKCDKISITYDPFMYLGLPIPSNQNKITMKYFPNILREFEYKYYEIDIPLSGNSSIKTQDIKIHLNQKFSRKFNNFNSNKMDLSRILRWFDLVVLTNEKMFKRVLKDDEEIAKVIENEGEIIAYERYPNREHFNERHDSVLYLNPINLKEESSMVFFNKTKTNNLYYPIALTVNRKENIKDLYFEIFKIYRKIIKDRQKTDINLALENLSIGKFDYLNKEFEIFFKQSKYNKVDLESPEVPFDLYFMNNIPEPTGFFSSKQICEFCDNKKCEFCRVCDSLDWNQSINNIFKRLKIERTICLLINFKDFQRNKFFNGEIFPFNVDEISKKPIILKSNMVNIYDCFNLFRSEEKLENENSWYCSNCKEHQEATKKMEIYKAPNILIIQLKRFKIKSTNAIMGMLKNGKNESKIDYPINGLDLKNYVVGDDNSHIYDLIGISQHFGNLSSGHYTALCKNLNKWYEFDDESVSHCPENKVVNSSAYLLFYRKRVDN